MLRTSTLVTLLALANGPALTEPIRSQAPRVWFSLPECWATVWPTVGLLIDDFGMSRIVKNSSDGIEHEVIDAKSGKAVMRIGCVAVPGSTAAFRRYFEIPSK